MMNDMDDLILNNSDKTRGTTTTLSSSQGGRGLAEHLLSSQDKVEAGGGWQSSTVRFDGDDNDDEEAAPLRAAGNTDPIDPTAASLVEAGQAQPRRFRDAWAAILFLIKQGFILYMALAWGWPNLKYTTTNDNTEAAEAGDDNSTTTTTTSYKATFTLLFLVGFLSLGLGAGMLTIMTRVAEQLLQGSLIVSCAANVLLCIWMAWQGSWVACAVTGLLALWTAIYARAVWRRIPLAASHLKTALQALQQNGSVILVALCMTFSLTLWVAVWMLAVLGIYVKSMMHHGNVDDDNDNNNNNTDDAHINGAIVALLLLSLFWTIQTSRNIVHVTVSGTVGTWWFCPDEANRFWSTAVTDSWRRSLTYSLGSICLGSLLTAIMHVLHMLASHARRQGQHRTQAASMLLCVLECLLRCTERLLTYFNKWAFVYVGLYGYDYLTAGQKVVRLFQERGWTNIIQDDLIVRCLQLVTLGLGCCTGALGVWMATLHPSWMAATWRNQDEQVSKTGLTATFGVFFVLGTAIGHLMMGVVASAVDTVLVTWAEAPLELERHYPGLYAAQVAAWRQAYPREFGM